MRASLLEIGKMSIQKNSTAEVGNFVRYITKVHCLTLQQHSSCTKP